MCNVPGRAHQRAAARGCRRHVWAIDRCCRDPAVDRWHRPVPARPSRGAVTQGVRPHLRGGQQAAPLRRSGFTAVGRVPPTLRQTPTRGAEPPPSEPPTPRVGPPHYDPAPPTGRTPRAGQMRRGGAARPAAVNPERYPRAVNDEHLRFCASAEWAGTVERVLLPWAVGRPGLVTDVLRVRVPRLVAVELDGELAAALGRRLSGAGVAVVQADATRLPF